MAVAFHSRRLEQAGGAERPPAPAKLQLLHGDGDEAAAGGGFRRAIDAAKAGNATSLELRAAMGLARMWRENGRSSEARSLLAGVYDRFTEGFDTPDLKDAKALLDALS